MGEERCALVCMHPQGDASCCRSDSSLYPCCSHPHMPPLASSNDAAVWKDHLIASEQLKIMIGLGL